MNSKKLLSILLIACMLFSIMPVAAFAASYAVPTSVFVGGNVMSVGSLKSYLMEDGTYKYTTPDDDEGWAHLEETSYGDYRLTLHNFDYKGTGHAGYSLIYYESPDKDLIINLEGENSLSEPTGANAHSKTVYGIRLIRANKGPELIIIGEGSLEINTDVGISVENSAGLTIESGKIDINATDTGIFCDGYEKVINIYGDLDINADGDAFKIRYTSSAGDSTLNFYEGKLNATAGKNVFNVQSKVAFYGGTATCSTTGSTLGVDETYIKTKFIIPNYMEAKASTSNDGTSPVPFDEKDQQTYKYLQVKEKEYDVWVGDDGLSEGQYMDESGLVGTTPLADNYACYKDGVLILHNFDYKGPGLKGYYLINAEDDLNVKLEGENTLNYSSEKDYGYGTWVEGNLEISGTGSLTLENIKDGLRAQGDIIIHDGEINIPGSNYGIDAPNGNIVIEDGNIKVNAEYYGTYAGKSVTILSGDIDIPACYYGIYASNGDVDIKDGNIKVNAEYYGIYAYKGITISGGNIDIPSCSYGIYAYEDVIISSGNIDITATYHGAYASESRFQVEGGDISLRSTTDEPEIDSYYYAISADFDYNPTLTVLASTEYNGELGEYKEENHDTYDWIKIDDPTVDNNGNGDSGENPGNDNSGNEGTGGDEDSGEGNEGGSVVPPSSSSGGGFSGVYNYPVIVGDTDGADVAVSDDYAVKGEKITITVKPEAGEQVDEVIVTDKDGKVIPVTKTGDNEYTFTMPASKVTVDVATEAADYGLRIVMQINNKNILVNGKTMVNDVTPVIVGDRTLVPIRVVTELLGGSADWDNATRTVTLKIDGKTMNMTIGKEIPGFGTSAVIMNDRTYVPVRYVMEMLGAEVEWINATRQIIIEK